MRKIDRIILYGMFYTSGSILICYFLWSIIFGKPLSELVIEDDLNRNFTGRVDSLYFDVQNHNVKMALLSNGYKYGIYRLWENQVEIGDSLLKKENTFLLFIYL